MDIFGLNWFGELNWPDSNSHNNKKSSLWWNVLYTILPTFQAYTMLLWRCFLVANLPLWPSTFFVFFAKASIHSIYEIQCYNVSHRAHSLVDMNTKKALSLSLSATCRPKLNSIYCKREKEICSLTRKRNICAESPTYLIAVYHQILLVSSFTWYVVCYTLRMFVD